MLAHLSIRVQKVLQRGEKKTRIQSHALVFVRVCVCVGESSEKGVGGRVSHFLPQICLTFYFLVTPSGLLGFKTTSCLGLYLMTIRVFSLLDSSDAQFIMQKISRKTAHLSPLFTAS